MPTLFVTTIAALLVGSGLTAQQASYTYIDQPPQYSNPTWLQALNTPRIGAVFQVQVPLSYTQGVFPCISYSVGFYYLLTGLSNPLWDLGAFGISGVLYSSAEAIEPTPLVTGYTGTAVMSLSIPNDPSFLGLELYQQVYGDTTVVGACFPGWSSRELSRAGHGIIGL